MSSSPRAPAPCSNSRCRAFPLGASVSDAAARLLVDRLPNRKSRRPSPIRIRCRWLRTGPHARMFVSRPRCCRPTRNGSSPRGECRRLSGAPYFRITIAGTERSLAATAEGELVASSFTGAPEQLWRIDQLTDGTYRITSKAVPGMNGTLALSAAGSSMPTLAKFDPRVTVSAGFWECRDEARVSRLCCCVSPLPPASFAPGRNRRAPLQPLSVAPGARRNLSIREVSYIAGWCSSPYRSRADSPKTEVQKA
jgi:hypothetical protein